MSCDERKECCDSENIAPAGIRDESEVIFKNLITTIYSLVTTVAKLKEVMNELISENKKLPKDIENMKAGGSTASDCEASREAIIAEAVVIRGFHEPAGDLAQQQKDNDFQKVKES